MSEPLKPIIAAASAGALNSTQAQMAFKILFSGEATPSQIGGLLMAMRTRGESVDEYAAAAQVMRENCNPITAPKGAMDIVGTGGDGKSTLNISTATAIVVAGAGVTVAKHGNRNLSSQSGASDALEQSGVNVMVDLNVVQSCIDRIGLAFMMAPMHHPAVKHVMATRTELGTRTIFNILGPLTNPAGVKHQLTGAFSADLLRPMAQTLLALGSESAWLVHGGDGTDEISIAGQTQIAALKDGQISEFSITPADAGLPTHPFDAIIGGSPDYNAQQMALLLDGHPSAYRDAVLLNAAAALLVAGRVDNLPAGVKHARDSIDSGKAKAKLAQLAKATSGT